MEREFRALDLLVKTNREKDREPRRVQLAEDVPKETPGEEGGALVTSFSGNLLFVVLLLCVQEAKREHDSRPFLPPSAPGRSRRARAPDREGDAHLLSCPFFFAPTILLPARAS